MFDPQHDQPYANISADDINDKFAQQVNSDVAHQSLVLLQNDDGPAPVLPFKLSTTLASGEDRVPPLVVAVIGPLANSSLVLEGSYGRSMKEGDFPSLFDAVRAMVEEAAPGAATVFAPGVACSKHGCSDMSPDPQLLAEATALANRADIVLVMVGLQVGCSLVHLFPSGTHARTCACTGTLKTAVNQGSVVLCAGWDGCTFFTTEHRGLR